MDCTQNITRENYFKIELVSLHFLKLLICNLNDLNIYFAPNISHTKSRNECGAKHAEKNAPHLKKNNIVTLANN